MSGSLHYIYTTTKSRSYRRLQKKYFLCSGLNNGILHRSTFNLGYPLRNSDTYIWTSPYTTLTHCIFYKRFYHSFSNSIFRNNTVFYRSFYNYCIRCLSKHSLCLCTNSKNTLFFLFIRKNCRLIDNDTFISHVHAYI